MLNYNPDLGFKFGIDAVFNADPNFLYVGFTTLNPPGGIYVDPPLKE